MSQVLQYDALKVAYIHSNQGLYAAYWKISQLKD